MEKTIESHMYRKFTVSNERASGAVIIETENSKCGDLIVSRLANSTAVELGEAIIEAAGKRAFVFEGRMPGSSSDGKTVVKSGNFTYNLNTNPDSVLEEIKALITIRDVLILEAEEKKQREALEAAEALKLKLRRDNLTKEFCGSDKGAYINLSDTAKAAVDRVIELEDKLEAKDA